MRLWKIDLAGAADPVAIGPASVPHGRHPITPDGDWIALAADHGVRLVSTGKHDDVVIDDANAEEPLRYSIDGTGLFICNQHSWPRVIRRIDLGTSKAADWMTIDDPTKPRQFDVEISGDGKRVVYSVSDETSDLYVIEPPAK
jgi:hypothetical protein